MKEILLAILSRIKQPIDGKLRHSFSVFLVCAAISTLMWGLIKMTREYEAPVKYSIIPDKLPDGKILTSNPDSVITLILNAKGLDLYSRTLFRRNNSVKINLSKVRLRREGDSYKGTLKSTSLMKAISEQLPLGAKLIGIEPDTLHFTFHKSYKKRVAVHPQLSLDFNKQYQLYDSIHIRPDSVLVEGLQKIVDTLSFINTEKKSYRNLNANITSRLALVRPETFPAVKLAKDSVTITLNVEKFTESDLEVPVSLYAQGKSVSYRIFPEKVVLTCRVAMRDYKRMDPSLFTASVDYEEVQHSQNNRVLVQIRRKPSFARVMRIEPEKVEFLILK